MSASTDKTSPLRSRMNAALAGISALEDMGFVVKALVLNEHGAILYLREHPANDRLLGNVRRIRSDETGRWLECEKIVDRVRVRWSRPWHGPLPNVRRIH